MGCPSCGAENPAAAKFCEECGTRLPRRCPSCGHEVGATAKFCLECGERLDGAPQRPAASSPPLAPQSYTPRHLAEKILASRSGLEGERKQVTVLFADIVGSTELIRDRDPEDAQRLLDGAVQRMMAAVHRYEGTVSRLLGDGLMAMFGAPVAHEDHALRACYAALAMHEAARRQADELRRTLGVTVNIRTGLCSGEVVVRTISDDLHMDYTAMGQTVHLAARMEQLSEPGTATMTADTLALVEGYVQVRSLGPVPVKGLDAPIEIYQLIGAEQARTRLQAAAARGLTRFVGRDAEMATLHTALERAAAGHGQIAALVGEPGVGKSRLVWELTHSHRTEGWTFLESGSVSYGKATSYLPVIDLLKAYCRIEARDDERAIREKVLGKLLNLDENLRTTLPAILTLLDVDLKDATWQALDPAQRRRQTLDAIKRLLLRESQERPLLLVFEDLHWIDSETQALLDGLVEGLPSARILLLVNYRPEYHHGWANRSNYAQLRIDPLGEASAGELLAGLLGDDPALDPLKSLLRQRTEGNPLFLEESVRSLVESGALAGERAAYRLTRPVAEVRVSATVQAVLAARIDRLRPEEKRLLQIAAVIGKDVPDALLQLVAGAPEDELRRGLDALREAEFLYEASLFPEPEYTFKHALTHEVAYGGLLQERRKALHGRVVDALESVYADRLDEQTELLAHHAARAERWERSLTYAQSAGDRASARSINRAAIAYFEQGLAALAHLPEERPRLEQAIDLRIRLRQALAGTGRDRDTLAYLREAEAIAVAIGDRRRQARIAAQACYSLQTVGDTDGAVEAGRRALAIAEELGDLPVLVVARHRQGQVFWQSGLLRSAAAIFRQVIATVPDQLAGERFDMGSPPAVEARVILGDCLMLLGDSAEAHTVLMEAVSLAEAIDHPYTLMTAYHGAGWVLYSGGRVPEALPLLERAHALAVSLEVPSYVMMLGSSLGHAYAYLGRMDEALALVEQAVRLAESIRSRNNAGRIAALRGDVFRRAGRIIDARRQAELARDVSRERRERTGEAFALHVLGEIAAQDDTSGGREAEARYREALALAEELEMRPLQAHCHLGLGKLYRRTGRLDEARAELATAVAMLREMGMAFWLPEAERELAEAE